MFIHYKKNYLVKELANAKVLLANLAKSKKDLKSKQEELQSGQTRHWLITHGLEKYLEFTDS